MQNLSIQNNLETISKFGSLTYTSWDSMYTLRLKLVTNVDLVTKILNELVSISNSNFSMPDFFDKDDYVSNKKFASYMSLEIKNSSIDGLILKFISRFKKTKRYDA